MHDRQHNRWCQQFRKKSLRELQTQHTTYTRGIEGFQREIALLEAQITGLKEHRPDGFAVRIEELREAQAKQRSLIDLTSPQLTALIEVIKEKESQI